MSPEHMKQVGRGRVREGVPQVPVIEGDPNILIKSIVPGEMRISLRLHFPLIDYHSLRSLAVHLIAVTRSECSPAMNGGMAAPDASP